MKIQNDWNPEYTLEYVKKQLDKEKIKYEIIETFLEQNQVRYKRGKRQQFEEMLCKKGIGYFAYIKFFESEKDKSEDNSLIAIVAGKSGSKNVNAYGSDVRFLNYPKPGKAKKWLYDNKMRWYHPSILVIRAQKKEEALKVERQLIKKFNLLES